NFPVSNIVYQGYFHDPRLKTSANHAAKFEAGTWGRKTGSGWFSYAEGAERPSPDFVPTGAPSPVCLAEDSDALRALADELRLNVKPEDGTLPILAAPVGEDATRTAIRLGMEARRLVCVDPLGDRSKRVTLMTAPGAHPRCLDSVAAGIVAGGRVATAIKDSPGFVGQRIAAMVANLGCYMAEIGLAAPEDIDLAMTLGLNYPQGPLALVETIGAERTHTVLASAQTLTGEDRYRPTLWLSRRAALGLPIHTPN
ncbi:MAG: 3-hydroxyacyl-CoA dehydrogenase family protein, partial [Pseudomonadota bacterium]